MVLVLQVCGNIASRIQSLLSGICWAEDFQTSLEVYWWTLPNMSHHCPFDSLFNVKSLPPFVSIKSGYLEQPTTIRSQSDFIEKGYPLHIKSNVKFYEKDDGKWIDYLKQLRPAKHLDQRIKMIPSQNTIGIYVHHQKETPLSQILTTLWTRYREPKQYLLSTDCFETKRFCELFFRTNVFFLNPFCSPHDEKHLYDQIVDLYAFSRCAVILDCSRSELMLLASLIETVEYVTIV